MSLLPKASAAATLSCETCGGVWGNKDHQELFLEVFTVLGWLHVAWSSNADCTELCFADLQTGVKVTNVNDLQDIDELCVVEVSGSVHCAPVEFSTAVKT